ncbi:MAG: S41 family peptidase [Nitrospinales bacterium]
MNFPNSPQWKRGIRKFAVGAAVALVCFFLYSPGGFWGSAEHFPAPVHAGFFSDDLELFDEVLTLISDRYVYEPDYKKIFSSAIEEMLSTAGLENLIFENTGSGQTIIKGAREVSYQLNTNRSHDLRAFKHVYYFLADEFKGSPDKKELEVAGIVGMMKALDPFSQYLDKELFKKSMRDTEGRYGGLGMVITLKDLQLTVVRTMKNSPARRAHILPDDIITHIDGKSTKGLQIDELASRLRGLSKTKVTLTIFRPGTREKKTYTLTREIISVETVSYKPLGRTGYIKITSFSKQTNKQLKRALREGLLDGVKSFILDLRNNPGGLLDQSVHVASHFLTQGQMVVYTQGRDKDDRREYRAIYRKNFNRYPMIILINQHSASAAEIVAGALRDSGRALIVGEKSYGKGTVQTIFRIRDGSGLRITTSKYYTPSGIDITREKIVPEIRIVDDLLHKTGDSFLADVDSPHKLFYETSISLKKSDVEKFLKERGKTVDRENDPVVLFAQMILQDSTTASKSYALAKARELAANILY